MLHILLVEDNPADVLLIREGIRASSVEADVVIAYDGEQALKLLSHCDIDFAFIFLDLNLPKFSGLELLNRYHAQQGPPVVVLTGSSNPHDEMSARQLGASDYIVKPLAFDDYINAVRSAVERWGAKATATGS